MRFQVMLQKNPHPRRGNLSAESTKGDRREYHPSSVYRAEKPQHVMPSVSTRAVARSARLGLEEANAYRGRSVARLRVARKRSCRVIPFLFPFCGLWIPHAVRRATALSPHAHRFDTSHSDAAPCTRTLHTHLRSSSCHESRVAFPSLRTPRFDAHERNPARERQHDRVRVHGMNAGARNPARERSRVLELCSWHERQQAPRSRVRRARTRAPGCWRGALLAPLASVWRGVPSMTGSRMRVRSAVGAVRVWFKRAYVVRCRPSERQDPPLVG